MNRKKEEDRTVSQQALEKDELPDVMPEKQEKEHSLDENQAPEKGSQSDQADKETNYQEELEDTRERVLRLQAEFQNYKRRVEKEKSDLYAYGCEGLAKDLLLVVDNLERALSTIKAENDSVYQGVSMIHEQLKQVLEQNGITEIEALGQPFDMYLHHAVMTEPCEEEELDNTVANVMQKGYRLKDRVLRPSMVKVYQV